MEAPRQEPERPLIWAVSEAPDGALLRRLELCGLRPTTAPEGCQVALLDFRCPKAPGRISGLRTEAATRDLLVLALVDDTPEAFRAALEAGADGFVCADRLEQEVAFRVKLLLLRQHEREAALRHERDLAALLELTSDYAQTRDGSALLHKVTRRLAEELQITRCALIIFEDDRAHGRIVAASDDAQMTNRMVELEQYPELREVARSGQPLLLPDAPRHPLLDPVKDRIAGMEIGAIAAVPLSVQGRVLGALLLRAGPQRRTFSPREMALATTVGHATAVALRNGRLLEHAEARLASLAPYQGLFNAFFHGLAVVGEDGELWSLNPAGARLLGLEAPVRLEQLMQRMSPAGEEAVQELLHRARSSEPTSEIDVAFAVAGGQQAMLAISAARLGAEAGPNLERAVILCFRDVTQARATQAELRKTKEFLEQLIDQASDAIIAADMKGTVIVFNRGAERIYGHRAEEALGRLNVRDLYPPGVAKELMRKIRSEEHGGKGRLGLTRAEIVAKSGERVPVNMTAALITEELGGVGREMATVGIFSDLRERMSLEQKLSQTQEKLQQTERAAVIAELAGTAAHELNQPLTSIMGYSELLRRRLRDEDPLVRPVDIIYREAERMAEIVRKIGKITRYETKAYVGGARIVDLDRAAGEEEA